MGSWWGAGGAVRWGAPSFCSAFSLFNPESGSGVPRHVSWRSLYVPFHSLCIFLKVCLVSQWVSSSTLTGGINLSDSCFEAFSF